jgi:hypothetical protein
MGGKGAGVPSKHFHQKWKFRQHVPDRECEINVACGSVISSESEPKQQRNYATQNQQPNKDLRDAMLVGEKRDNAQLPRDRARINKRYKYQPDKLMYRLQEYMCRNEQMA